jgi:dipeptidyl aminopeptidase/acylaminoacyl peptidase
VRLVLTTLVFVASLVAAVFVHAAKADAAWEQPQQIDRGSSPHVRLLEDGRPFLAYAQGEQVDPSRLLVSEGNEPTRRVKVPRAGRVVAFDVDGAGRLVALRQTKRRIVALEGRRWRNISPAASRGVDAQLAVAASGAAVAAWLQYEGRRVVVHAALKPSAGNRFGAPQRLSGLTGRTGQTLTVAVDDAGEALVTWDEAGDLTMARTAGGSFATPVRVHDRTEVVAGAFSVASAIRGQTAVVAFTRLEDREPPEYRLSVATALGDTAPVVETVAQNVSAFDIAAAVEPDGTPLVLSTPIGPPYSLRLHRRAAAWAEAASIPATEAPSTIGYADGAVTWTEGPKGFAWFAGRTLALGRAASPDAAVSGGRAIVVWDRGPGRTQRLATFTP